MVPPEAEARPTVGTPTCDHYHVLVCQQVPDCLNNIQRAPLCRQDKHSADVQRSNDKLFCMDKLCSAGWQHCPAAGGAQSTAAA